MDLFREGQRRVAIILQSDLSSIHITYDASTSSNHLAPWGMVGHFTLKEGKLECLLLSLTGIKGSYTGENQANMVLATLNSYDICNRLGYLVMDNATTNDTLMDYISADLESERISYDPWHYRLRCNSHIINLTVCVFFLKSILIPRLKPNRPGILG